MRHAAAVFALLVLGTIGILAGCATNPVTGKRELSLVSGEQLLSIGREGYEAVIREYGAYDAPALATYVNGVGQKLARVSHEPNLEWHFTLLDDPAVNAFAMPGGYIYVTRGILAHLNSEAQLAGVLGHEIAHVTARHTAQRISQQQLAGLGLGIAGAFSSSFRRYGQAAETALGLVFLKYGRDDENEADQLGIDYATKAGYDPREVPATYVMLRRVGEQSGQRVPTFLSTHPDPGDREVRTTALAKTAAAGKTGLTINARDYVQRLDDIVFGADPRQGYFEGTTFYHPTLRFQITFPSGWQTQNTRSAVAAGLSDQSAIMQLTLVPSNGQSPSAYVQSLLSGQKISDARGSEERVGGYPAWVGRLAVPSSTGATATLAAAFIAKDSDQFYQILGQTSRDDAVVFQSMRSFRGLTDAARTSVTPARVDVVTLDRSGSFSEVVASLGPQALGVEPTSILNNVMPDEGVARGTVLKVVRKGSR